VTWGSLRRTAVILSVKVAFAIPGVSSLLRSQAAPGHRYLPLLDAILVAPAPTKVRCWLRGTFTTASAAAVGARLSRLVEAARKRLGV
jgi:hypothetical protein